MHKPIDEKKIPTITTADSGECNCSCAKITESNSEEPSPKNDLAINLGKVLIEIGG
jgi:hypothetical protein